MERIGEKKRFLEKTQRVRSGCHEWQGTVTAAGYGRVMLAGKMDYAHRAAWTHLVGAIPDGMSVLHKCDNRSCVNIKHLYLGTQKDNMRDKVNRCPDWPPVTIPFEIVKEARRLYWLGGMTQQEVADKLGIKREQVSRYSLGQRKHR